jgi:hypothetical protein
MSLAILLFVVYEKLASWSRCNLSYKDTDTDLPNFWKTEIQIRWGNCEYNIYIYIYIYIYI